MTHQHKKFISTCCLVLISPLIILAWVEKKYTHSESIFAFLGQLLSLIPGKVGSYFRVAYYRGTLKACSHNVSIEFGSFFAHRNAMIGNFVNIGAYCVLGCVYLDNNILVGSRVSIASGKYQHIYSDDGWNKTPGKLTTVHVGEKTWIGEGAIVVDDIGEECQISAGTVVTKKIPSRSLVAGNPCRILKKMPLKETQ